MSRRTLRVGHLQRLLPPAGDTRINLGFRSDAKRLSLPALAGRSSATCARSCLLLLELLATWGVWIGVDRQGKRGHGGDITSLFAMSPFYFTRSFSLDGISHLAHALFLWSTRPCHLHLSLQPLASLFALLVQHSVLQEHPGGIPTPNLSDLRSRHTIQHSHP